MQQASSSPLPSATGEGVSQYGYLVLLGRVKEALDTAHEIVVPISSIRPYPTQPREYFNDDSIKRLSESIDAGGQTSSGMVREKPDGTQYELIDGERRWRAIGLIPESRRPFYRAKLIVADDDVVQYLISGITNFNREGHTAIETMKTIDRHIDFGFPMEEIARLLGISLHWAYQLHGLKKLKSEVRALLDPNLPKAQQLPVTAAVHISKIEPRLQLGLAERVISKDVTLGRLRGEVVKVAKREGSNIRLREVNPLKQWASLGNKVDVVARNAKDVEVLIKNIGITRFIKGRPNETAQLSRKLREARDAISRIEESLRKA